MQENMNPNAVNQFLKGSNIYTEGEPVSSIAMIIKGRVLMHNDGTKIFMGSGAFLGVNDLYLGRYQSTYTAYDDLILYIFSVNQVDELESVLTTNKDYHGIMVASFYKTIYELDQVYQGLIQNGVEIYQYLMTNYQNLLESVKKNGIDFKQSERINLLAMPESEIELIRDKIEYYNACKNLPIDAVKMFYSFGNAVTLYQLEDQAAIINQQIEELKELANSFLNMAGCLVDETDSCLFAMITRLSIYTDNIGGMQLIDILDSIIEQVNKAELFSERFLGKKLKVNRKTMEEGYHILLTSEMKSATGEDKGQAYSKDEMQKALSEIKDAYAKILDYSGIEESKAEEMKKTMNYFNQLKDKTSSDDSARMIRRQLMENHYEIYQLVFMRAYQEENSSRLIEMFLRYGFADERLLTDEQALSLYYLKNEQPENGLCNVYDIKDWLTMIYEGKKEPSKNEFDLEYPEMLADMKKRGQLSEKDMKIWLLDPEKKLTYEIQNMFRYNNRTTNGQLSSFVPILHKDQWAGDIKRYYLTSAKVNETLSEIIKVDYSAFAREMVYSSKEKNITKEYIIKKIYPDIILMPNVGSNGVMWQEISGKRRDSAGRFMLPIFTEVSLKTNLVRIIGRFRWELCRTIEGSAWNDITLKSLTSEYSDYIQFYRKNKELSEEKKEKIKMQIQRGRNNSREIFVLDYEQWILYESIGANKLNKIVREIMSTYCPFEKELRESIKNQPVYGEAMVRFYRDKMKKIREIEGRYRALQKDKIELTQELLVTLDFYKNQ
jgi:Cyclic nucleotide-binding domain.